MTVANMIKGKTPEEIRKTFNIRNDFTPEEEEEVRRENQWAFELEILDAPVDERDGSGCRGGDTATKRTDRRRNARTHEDGLSRCIILKTLSEGWLAAKHVL